MDEQKIMETYQRWLELAVEDADLKQELMAVAGDEEQIRDRFYRDLAFGTGGLRGVIGAGSNRMNLYTVRKATQGLCDWLNARYSQSAVAISFDSRIKSHLFAQEAARVLAANGIKAYLFAELEPTPVLSFAVRELDCHAGIMVTASHNPAKYNGYKCYGADGCQMTDNDANAVTARIEALDIFDDVKAMDFAQAQADGLIETTPAAVLEKFLRHVEEQQINKGIFSQSPLSVIYTPLNGTGNKPVRAILSRVGLSDVTVVPQQENPDGNFPTAPYPNPEIRQVFECGLEMAETSHPDLMVATDPDCDRVGLAVRQNGEYVLMTGNEVGCVMMNYILSCRKANGTLPEKPVVVTTIVTSKLTAAIAQKYGCELRIVLTGFKYIGEQIGLLEQAGEAERYMLGFEESYGYMVGTYVRDKDAVAASMLCCEMAAYYKKQGKTLIDVLNDLYAEFGVYGHHLINKAFEGEQGMAAMDALMTRLREHSPADIAGLRVCGISDYLLSVHTDTASGAKTPIDLPKSNVIAFDLEQHAGVVVRPSGTEPKVKAYITATGADQAAAAAMAERLTAAAEQLLV